MQTVPVQSLRFFIHNYPTRPAAVIHSPTHPRALLVSPSKVALSYPVELMKITESTPSLFTYFRRWYQHIENTSELLLPLNQRHIQFWRAVGSPAPNVIINMNIFPLCGTTLERRWCIWLWATILSATACTVHTASVERRRWSPQKSERDDGSVAMFEPAFVRVPADLIP